MNLKKLIFGVICGLVVAVTAGFLVGPVGFWVVAGLSVLALVSEFVDKFVFIRVGEMETAVVFNRETKAFSRFLPAGRHVLKFPLERVADTFSTAPAMVNSRCKNAQAQEGVTVNLDFTVAYQLSPGEIAASLQPSMARLFPSGADGLVKNNANNCVALVVNRRNVERLCQRSARGSLEREFLEEIQERLLPFGIHVFRVMVTSIELPKLVNRTLEEAHEHMVYAEKEAMGLERLHKVLKGFSDVDVERLLKLRQLRELGQNGVTMHVPYLGNSFVGENGSAGPAGNGRSPNGPTFPQDRPGGRTDGRPYS